MKISFDWLKEYLALDTTLEETAEILTAIGLEVGKVERYESVKGGLDGVVCGLVIDCVKHPNADRLSLCKVDIGNGTDLQIVCGAPNVAGGQKVWVARVGTTLYPTGSDAPFAINKVKVRGQTSEGMICAEDELGLGEDHAGIMVLPEETPTGILARDYYQVTSDDVIEIDLTPNRSDATSHLGVASDLAAYLNVNHGGGYSVRWPEAEVTFPAEADTHFTVSVENTEACPRYAGVVIEDITIGESPDWLKRRLASVGVRPINNVVDVTNFVLHEMGQPLHAFDADKIRGDGIIVKTLADGTPFVTLDEVERKLSDTDLMICDGNGQGMCIGGVFGGIGTGVSESTTRIFLESAHFNPLWIRRTSMRHLLRTDAARTFEKSTDPNVCVIALKRAAQLIRETAGGRMASGLTDIYPSPVSPAEVPVRRRRMQIVTGIDLDVESERKVFSALNMKILKEDNESLTVAVPTNKADVTREIDVIEEVLRIYGFDKVPLANHITVALNPVHRPTLWQMRNLIGTLLSSLGFYEMMGMSLTEERYYDEGLLALDRERWVVIENTSNVGLNLMRPDLMISALETARHNQSRNQDSFRLYEFGHSYQRVGDVMTETEGLTLLMSGDEVADHWLAPERRAVDYYVLKKYVEAVLRRLGISGFSRAELNDKRYTLGSEYTTDDHRLVEFGQLSEALIQQFDLRGEIFFARFDMQRLFSRYTGNTLQVSEISKFPAIKRDLAFDLPVAVTYAQLTTTIAGINDATLQEVRLFDVYKDARHLGEGRKSYAVQLLFENNERTLTDAEVDETVKHIVTAVESGLDGRLRG